MNLANLLPLIINHQKIKIVCEKEVIYEGVVQGALLTDKDAIRKINRIVCMNDVMIIIIEYPNPYWA